MRPLLSCLTLALVAIITLTSGGQVTEGASIWQSIPGAGFLRDMTVGTLGMVNDAIDSGMNSLLYETGIQDAINECLDCPNDPDTKRNVSEIIRSRGFEAEEYDVVTKDGYILTIQRIVNPLVAADYKPKMKPVIMQHGLMSSSVDWVINSQQVHPEIYPAKSDGGEAGEDNRVGAKPNESLVGDTQEHPNSLGFYLANKGYDVFLANSRGNIYGQRHVNMSSWRPKFWNFTFDEQIIYDLPDTIAFIQKLTGHTKVGYVGHSQGTAMMFGLLSDQPDYADIVEPFVALAPVAYVRHTISPAKYFAIYTPIAERLNMWFATSNVAVRYLGPIVCGPKVIRRDVCENLVFLGTGFNEDEMDDTRVSAYLAHMPSGTSVKNIAHYGQEIISGKFRHFDHGVSGNQLRYGRPTPPDYDLSKIRSKSIALFIASNDWLAAPKDVAHLRSDLKVEPFRVHNMTEVMPKWNHIDYVYGKHAGELVNTKIFDIMEHFRND